MVSQTKLLKQQQRQLKISQSRTASRRTQQKLLKGQPIQQQQTVTQQIIQKQSPKIAEKKEIISDLKTKLQTISEKRSQLELDFRVAHKSGQVGIVEQVTITDKGLRYEQKAINEVLDMLKTGYISKVEIKKYISARVSYGRERAEAKIDYKRAVEEQTKIDQTAVKQTSIVQEGDPGFMGPVRPDDLMTTKEGVKTEAEVYGFTPFVTQTKTLFDVPTSPKPSDPGFMGPVRPDDLMTTKEGVKTFYGSNSFDSQRDPFKQQSTVGDIFIPPTPQSIQQSIQQSLKTDTTIKDDKKNGISIISSRLPSGLSDRRGGSLLDTLGTGVSNLVSGFGDFKDGSQKGREDATEETYSQRLDMFVSAAPGVPDVSSSTLFARPPTGEERADVGFPFAPEKKEDSEIINISDIDFKTFDFGKQIFQEDISKPLTTKEKEFKKKLGQAEEVDKLTKELDKLNKKLISEGKIDKTTNTFTEEATKKEIDEYTKLYTKYEFAQEKVEATGGREVYIGLGGKLGREVDITQVETGVSAIPQFTGVVGGELFAPLGKEEGWFTIPEYKTIGIDPTAIQRKTLSYQPGQKIDFTETITIPKMEVGTTEQLRTVGTGVGVVGLYYALGKIPIIKFGGKTKLTGAGVLFAGTTAKEFKEVDYNVVEFAKEYPLQTAIIAGYGIGKGFKFAKGKLGKVEYYDELLTLPATKAKSPYSIVTRQKIIEKGGKVYVLRDVKGFSQTIQVGKRTIVTTRIRRWLGLDAVYLGNPYAEIEAYNKALKLLKSRGGYTDAQARKILRLRRPDFKENVFEGQTLVTYGDDAVTIELKGTQKTKDILGTQFDDVLLKRDRELKRIKMILSPTGKDDVYRFKQEIRKSFLTKEGREFQKLKQAGKTTEYFSGYTSSKKVGDVFLPMKNVDDLLIGKEFEAYRAASLSQKIIPKSRSITGQTTSVFVEKGEPAIKISFDSSFDDVIKLKGFKGGGKKSSPQFLDDMYNLKLEEQAVSAGLLKVVKGTTTLPPKTTIVAGGGKSVVKIDIPLMVGGAGLVNIPGIGEGTYERSVGGMEVNVPRGITGSAIKVDLDEKMDVGMKMGLDEEQTTSVIPTYDVIQATFVSPISKVSQATSPAVSQRFDQATLQKPAQVIALGIPIVPIHQVPQPPPPTKVPPPQRFFPKKKATPLALAKKEQAYHTYIKNKKISDVPLTERDALNFGGWVADNTLAAQFQIRKTRGKPKKSKYAVPGMNWMSTKGKFRGYRIKKGKRIPMKDKYIERKQFRLDSSGEVKKIQVARFLASQRKQSSKKQNINTNLQKTIFGKLGF